MQYILFDETGRLRTVWRFALFGTAALAILIGTYVALMAQTGSVPSTPDEFVTILEERQMDLVMVAAIPITVADLALVWLFRRRLDRRSMASLEFVKPGQSWSQSVVGGLLLGEFAITLVIVVLLAIGGLEWQGLSASLQTFLLIPVLIAMAFNEELVFRGYYLQNLIDIDRPVFGVLFSSAVFCLFHAANPGAQSSWIVPLNLFGAGIVFALAYRVSGNIWYPTALHFGWNFAMGVLFDIPISGLATDGLLDVRTVETMPEWLTGGIFGIEGSLLVTAAEIGLALLLWSAWRKPLLEKDAADPDTDDSPALVDETAASGAA